MVSQVLVLGIGVIISASCDSTCWASWFDGYYTGSNVQRSQASVVADFYCENQAITNFDVFVLTPVNSWSNYSFVFFGSLLITLGIYSFQNKDEFMSAPMSSQVKKNPSWLIYHGIILIWGGLGSFAFHASFTEMAI